MVSVGPLNLRHLSVYFRWNKSVSASSYGYAFIPQIDSRFGQQSVRNLKTMSLSLSDPNSFSRPEEALVKSFHWDIVVDFEKKIIKGHVDLSITKAVESAQFVLLDSSEDLIITQAVCPDSKAILDVDRSEKNPLFGICTKVRLPESNEPKVRIYYETSPSSSALQWMTPEQTTGKKQPYVYSHSEAIHSRALLPCQDSPNVKAPFTARISVPKDVVAVLSAVKTGEESGPDNSRVFLFSQKVPVPIYLLALAVGDLHSKKVGPRSCIWSENEYLDKALVDFADTEIMIKTAENLLGEYIWGPYDLLVLPFSFPFGGMENPCLTFMTPSVLAGDKSLANVVAHEIAHSWTGNLVTNKNFEHFWLNEGFTVYVERKILGRMFGEAYRQFSAMEGLKALKFCIEKEVVDAKLTKLVVDLKNVHPDDSFSTVPYEKGHTFLFYLETLLGTERMDEFLKAYVERFKYKSIVTDDWKDFFFEFFAEQKPILDQVDWDAWLYGTGMPPIIPDYKSEYADACIRLSNTWRQSSLEELLKLDSKDYDEMNPLQKQVFLAELIDGEALSRDKMIHMTKLYKLNEATNSEICFRWMLLGIAAKWDDIIEPVTSFLRVNGRMKFVSPLFRDFGGWTEKRHLALELFEELKPTMMYVTRSSVEKALKSKAQ